MALMLPLEGTETSVCRRVGRPRCQALEIAPTSQKGYADHATSVNGGGHAIFRTTAAFIGFLCPTTRSVFSAADATWEPMK